MTINTKLNIDDPIFFISDNKKVANSIVRGFRIEHLPSDKKTTITYLCNSEVNSSVNIKVNEDDAYSTKEALINSL